MEMARGSGRQGCSWLVVAALLSLLGLARPLDAAEFACAAGDVPCLFEAIHVANTNGEANTITLAAGVYTLTAVDNDTDGPTGLPSITGSLTITGAGADTTIIKPATGTPPLRLRLLHVAASGTLTLDGLTLQGGNLIGLPDGGGGVRNHGTLTVTHSLLRGHAASSGGGILSDGTLLITHSTLSGNTASSSGSGGGILHNGRNLTIADSTLSGNFASGNGGGITLATAFGASITNSTLRGNMAGRDGGGISLPAFTLPLTNSMVSGNLAGQGGGISLSIGGVLTPPGQAILRNTILAQNTATQAGAGADCVTLVGSNQVTSLGHNLLGNLTGCRITLTTSDRTGDPGLGPFTDGTPGQGYVPLLPTSRAIDAGDPAACPASDQLGQQRVTPCDIGAVEFSPVTLTLGLNQATVRPGNTLRVRLGIHTRGPTVTADAYLGVLLPDGMTVLFVTSLAPLDGVVTRLDADPRTFAPLATAYDFPPGLEVTVEDYFVYAVTGDEPAGSYAIFTFLTPPGAFADGQVDAGDLRALTLQPFTISP